jgi:hypothetical protein
LKNNKKCLKSVIKQTMTLKPPGLAVLATEEPDYALSQTRAPVWRRIEKKNASCARRVRQA